MMSVLHRTARLSAFAVVAIASLSSALAAFPKDQVSTKDDSVRVLTNGGRGSGNVFHNEVINGFRSICVVTADHVLKGKNAVNIGIGNQATGFTIPVEAITDVKVALGGDQAFKADIGFIGLTIRENLLNAAQQAALAAITPVELFAAGENNWNLTGYGYGTSADLFQQPNGFTAGYRYMSNNAQHEYGTQRFWNQTVTKYRQYKNARYDYRTMEWVLDTPGQLGEGQANSGDSGGGLFFSSPTTIGDIPVFEEKQIGVLTNVWGDGAYNLYATYVNDVRTSEDFFWGSIGGGVAFTQDHVDWLHMECAGMVPEPGTLVAIGLGVIAMLRRRKSA